MILWLNPTPPKEVRDLRALVRYRASLVRARTAIKNRVHSLLDRYGFEWY
ncbi:hypothetical protein DRO55_05940 [Candidatus Bathyarchaeota archaeon]|nr:MAG: hypothetical protein DRO55_05940 [Candidatus Bathyarchaeota archaeon]